jgi:hypothetical protein
MPHQAKLQQTRGYKEVNTAPGMATADAKLGGKGAAAAASGDLVSINRCGMGSIDACSNETVVSGMHDAIQLSRHGNPHKQPHSARA